MEKNTQTITKEFCTGKKLRFKPQTIHEAAYIQRKLFEMGFQWGTGPKIKLLEECVYNSLTLVDGNLYYGESEKNALLCTSQQFEEPFDPSNPAHLYVPPEQTALFEAFNTMAQRIENLETQLKETNTRLKDIQEKLDEENEPQIFPSRASLHETKP